MSAAPPPASPTKASGGSALAWYFEPLVSALFKLAGNAIQSYRTIMIKLTQLAGSAVLLAALSACSTTRQEDGGGTQDVSAIENKLTITAFAIADVNGDGAITFEELQVANPDATLERFRMLDSDASGTLSADELEIGIDRHGGFLTLMSKIDDDKDGIISDAESERFDQALVGAENLHTFEQLKGILD